MSEGSRLPRTAVRERFVGERTRPARGPRDPVHAAAGATYAAFAGCGYGPTTYVARLPQVRAQLHLSTGQVGVILLAAAAGALFSRPFAHRVILGLGLRGAVTATAVVAGAGQALLGFGYLTGVPTLVTGLMLLGFSVAIWDVAMNVEGAIVEQRLGRTIMPRFHAGYSVGTVAGAFTATGMVLAGVPVVVHMVLTGALTAVAVPLAVRGFLAGSVGRAAPTPAPAPAQTGRRADGTLRFWREPRTLLIGLFVLAFGFGEGAGNDWIGVGVVSGYHASAVVGTAAYAAFLAATTATRWFGTSILDRYSRATVLRAFCATAAAGLMLFCSGFTLVAAFIGVALWGGGIAFGYPVGMSAAADDPRYATERVTVVSTIGKLASFLGPPLLGLLGDNVSILRALIAVAVLQLLAATIATATRPPEARASAAAHGPVAVSEKA